VFLRSSIGPEVRDYSEQTARLVDEEIRVIVTEALERARTTLRKHRDKVEALAARLLSTEVVEEDELRRILGPKVTAQTRLLADQAPEEKADDRREEKPVPAGPWGQTHA
jgi:cell division protease FtsH